MKKIFEPEVEQYLLDMGISKNEIIKTKFQNAKEETISRLEQVIRLIKKEEFKEVKQLTSHSGSGDGYGQDNYYIDFRDIIGQDSLDISDICEFLKLLKDQIKS